MALSKHEDSSNSAPEIQQTPSSHVASSHVESSHVARVAVSVMRK